MTVMMPYLLISLLFVVLILSIVFICRNFHRKFLLIEERLSSLENGLEKTKIALGDQSSRNAEEINHNASVLREEIRSALQKSIESVMARVTENDTAYKAGLDSVITQITGLQRNLQDAQANPVEKRQATVPLTAATKVAPPTTAAQAKPTAKPPEDASSKARRLARLIVSEIALYNRKNVEQGVRDGNFYELLAYEVREARSLYERRIPEEIRNTTAYLDEAFAELILKTRRGLNL